MTWARTTSHPIHSTRGVTKLVSVNGLPATVPDPHINALVQTAGPDTELLHSDEAHFKPGTTVTIVDGPLAGLDAFFKAHDGEARSIILLELLGKTRQLNIDRNQLGNFNVRLVAHSSRTRLFG